MTQDRVRPESEHGRHPSALDRDRPMPIRVDTQMHAMQRSVTHPGLDHLLGHSEPKYLPTRDHTVLASGEPRHHAVVARGRVLLPGPLKKTCG